MSDYEIEQAAKAYLEATPGGADWDRASTRVRVRLLERMGTLADAGLLARPLPHRDEIKTVLQREFGPFLAHDPANPDRFWGQSADAVLALLKGQDR